MATPLHIRFPDETERFWSQVDKGGGCWLWTGAVDHYGYGISAWGGRTARAHRVSLFILGVEMAPGEMACHHCDVRHCVNPDHLYVGDAQTNVDDAWARGRARPGTTIVKPQGESNPAHKLNEDSVRWIRQQHAAGRTARSMAAALGVSKTAVGFVIHGKTWTHVQ